MSASNSMQWLQELLQSLGIFDSLRSTGLSCEGVASADA